MVGMDTSEMLVALLGIGNNLGACIGGFHENRNPGGGTVAVFGIPIWNRVLSCIRVSRRLG